MCNDITKHEAKEFLRHLNTLKHLYRFGSLSKKEFEALKYFIEYVEII